MHLKILLALFLFLLSCERESLQITVEKNDNLITYKCSNKNGNLLEFEVENTNERINNYFNEDYFMRVSKELWKLDSPANAKISLKFAEIYEDKDALTSWYTPVVEVKKDSLLLWIQGGSIFFNTDEYDKISEKLLYIKDMYEDSSFVFVEENYYPNLASVRFDYLPNPNTFSNIIDVIKKSGYSKVNYYIPIELQAEEQKTSTRDIERALRKGFHLGGGLCIKKHKNCGYEAELCDVISLNSCYDFLPIDTAPPTRNILKYEQGGLCFYYDCKIEPSESFTAFLYIPHNFIDSNEYTLFISKYSDSQMIYKYKRIYTMKSTFIDVDRMMLKAKSRPKATKSKPTKPVKEDFVIFKDYDNSWENMFSISAPLKFTDENFTDYCNSKFCSTKDFIFPETKVHCSYKTNDRAMNCSSDTLPPKCVNKLDSLTRIEHWTDYSLIIEGVILLHSGKFPIGDCDLSNWRYIKIDSLDKEHYEKLRELVTINAKQEKFSNIHKMEW